jgi:hypothetical protein
MSEVESKSAQFVFNFLGLALITVLAYLLSVGPALYLANLYPELTNFFEKLYWPLFNTEIPWIFDFLDWYLPFWIVK